MGINDVPKGWIVVAKGAGLTLEIKHTSHAGRQGHRDSRGHAAEEEDMLLPRFCSNARKVVLMCRVCMYLRVASNAFMEDWATLTKYSSKTKTEEEQRESSKAAFDLHYFKAQRDNLSNREIQITMKVPECRSMEELELLLVALRSLLSFRHYSKSYQLLLAKIMRYECFRRRRVIIRKGDPANSFYFIYSGGVSFTTDQDGASAFKQEQPANLRKGARFGEIPVLKGLRRNFTAVCVEDTELLVVDREDFFANKLDQVLLEEAHHRFIFFRSLKLLQSLPDSSIEVLSDYSTTEEFLYGQVIPHDVDNLIFVTKGRFVILRLVDLSSCHSYHKFIAQELPFIKNICGGKESIGTFKIDKRLLSLTSRRASLFHHQKLTAGRMGKMQSLSVSSTQYHPSINSRKIDTSGPSSAMPSGSRLGLNLPAEDWKLQKMGSATSLSAEDIPLLSDNLATQPAPSHSSRLPKALAVAVYMQVDAILPGEVFGLRQYFLPTNVQDKRHFSTKSMGTKIVRVDLETFSKMADHQTQQKVRRLQLVYPSDDKLCGVFIRNNAWKIFKKDTVGRVTRGLRRPCTREEAALPGQGEAVYEMDKTGLLNLPKIASDPPTIFSKPSYFVTPVLKAKEEGDLKLPEVGLQLIHGIEKIPSSLKQVLF
ncbi:cyclic nucleotide-binding domain-containing protein 2-like isoform X3 [Narcine bancroftii]|uniref:cyclic nucleotide-binding domain-containing protein 2-like isoform X3 n=1 Tax=Narcine bancroftii TaxID=1343680 RepID=UPI0038318A73